MAGCGGLLLRLRKVKIRFFWSGRFLWLICCHEKWIMNAKGQRANHLQSLFTFLSKE